MTSEGPIREASGKIAEALEVLSDYSYRKEFGLSYSEFASEPIEEYLRNKEIMGIINEIQRAMQRRMKRESARQNM